jgi:hypothetical protein
MGWRHLGRHKRSVVAKSIERNSAGERAWLLPEDRLWAISMDPNGKGEPITNARSVQIYLDEAGIHGQLHYLMEGLRTRKTRGSTTLTR